MSTTTNLVITKLDPGLRQPEVVINNAFDAFDAAFAAKRARVYHNANQSIANSTAVALAFNSERYDTDLIHDPSTNNTRLTCKTAGNYSIIGSVLFDVNATGQRLLEIRLNGSTLLADQRTNAIGGGVLGTGLTIAIQYVLAVNDYVELLVFQNSGGSLNILSAGNYTPEFMMARIGL